MTITKKKFFMVVGLVIMLLTIILLVLNVPIKRFSYYTSTGCNSNLYGGGNIKYFKYGIIDGEANKYENKKSELESLKVPQSGFCEGKGVAPTDYTTIELFLF